MGNEIHITYLYADLRDGSMGTFTRHSSETGLPPEEFYSFVWAEPVDTENEVELTEEGLAEFKEAAAGPVAILQAALLNSHWNSRAEFEDSPEVERAREELVAALEADYSLESVLLMTPGGDNDYILAGDADSIISQHEPGTPVEVMAEAFEAAIPEFEDGMRSIVDGYSDVKYEVDAEELITRYLPDDWFDTDEDEDED